MRQTRSGGPEPDLSAAHDTAAGSRETGSRRPGSRRRGKRRSLLLASLDASLEAAGALRRAARRSGGDVRAVAEATPNLLPDTTAVFTGAARAADLARAQAFLWAEAGLTAGERASRALSAEVFGSYRPLPGSRALSLAAVASDLYLGYAVLRDRERRFPSIVGPEDWALQDGRGATLVKELAGELGGVLIKAGQFASTRPDLLPESYTGALASLQDRLPPERWEVMKGTLARELGGPVEAVFREIDPVPVAAASIAQVHRGRLHDGREVAVKIQYPGVDRLIEADLDALDRIFTALNRLETEVRLQPIADYLRWTLPLELDFEREAAAIKDLREALKDRDDVVVPEVVDRLTTGRLVVMEYVDGVKLTDRPGLEAAGIDPVATARLLNDVYADQMFRHGVLHADPHPGNLFVRRGADGPVLVLLDHGLTLSLPEDFVAALGRTVETLRAGDFEELTPALEAAGLSLKSRPDLDTLLQLVGVLLGGESVVPGDTGEVGRKLGTAIGDIPPRLLLAGRAIGILDGITRQLDPDLDALEIVSSYIQPPPEQ